MRIFFLVFPYAVSIFVTLFAAASAEALPFFEFGAPRPAKIKAPLRLLEFKIQKLSCPSCAASYIKVLALTPGIKYARVELRPPRDADSLVIFDSRTVSRAEILETLHKFHYYESDVKQQ